MLKKTQNSGFTLLELMIAVLLISIGAATTVFTFRTFLPDIRLKAAVRNLDSDLMMARMVAIRERKNVGIIFDVANDRYDIFIDDGAGDSTYAANRQLDSGETVIKSVKIATDHLDVTIESATFGGGVANTTFNARGLPLGANGTVTLKNRNGKQRSAVLTMLGRVQIQD